MIKFGTRKYKIKTFFRLRILYVTFVHTVRVSREIWLNIEILDIAILLNKLQSKILNFMNKVCITLKFTVEISFKGRGLQARPSFLF